jgi:hypothetical protein
MDEQIEAIYMTAIECLANLIAPKKDEVKEKLGKKVSEIDFTGNSF